MDYNATIKITRLSNIIYSSRDIVMLALDKVNHLMGQFILADYRDELGKINTILVIGKINGTGRDAYSVISTGGDFVVNKVNDLADVSEISHGTETEIHLAQLHYPTIEDELDWFIVTLGPDDITRTIEPITRSRIFKNLDDNYRWFYIKETKTLKREDDFFSTDYMQGQIDIILNSLNKPSFIVKYNNQSNNNYYIDENTEIINPTFEISIINYNNEDITDQCIIKLDGNIIEPEENTHNFVITGTFSSDTEFNFTATYLETIELEKTVNFYFPQEALFGRYQIINENVEIDEDSIRPKRIYADLDDIDITYNLETDEIIAGEIPTLYYSILLVPQNFDHFTHIFDINGLDYIHDYNIVDDFEYSEVNYTAYLKTSGAFINGFRQKFTYNNEILVDPVWEDENEKNNYYTKGEVLGLISNIYRELINDRSVDTKKTWSSTKIYNELAQISDRIDEETRTRFTLTTTALNDIYYADTNTDTTMTVVVNSYFDNELVDLSPGDREIPAGWTRQSLGTYTKTQRGTYDNDNIVPSQIFSYTYNKLRIEKASEEKKIDMVFPSYYGLTDSNLGFYPPETMSRFISRLNRITSSLENQPTIIQNTTRDELFLWLVTLGKAEVIVNSDMLKLDLYSKSSFISPFNPEIKLDYYNVFIYRKPIEPESSISVSLTLPVLTAEEVVRNGFQIGELMKYNRR